jgi:DNA-binding PucR family transcriptional regulator
VASVDLDRIVAELPEFDGSAAIGEIGPGLEGWRFTHSQAQAGYRVALKRPRRLQRYSAVAMASAVASDQVLRRSLQQLYIDPLGAGDRGTILRDTLRAYLATSGNCTAAGSLIGVARQTVASRIRTAEARLGKAIASCDAELRLALEMD